jgi:hypothetical protein
VRAPSITDARRPRHRPRRDAAFPAIALALTLLAATSGCATDPPDVREGKAALDVFLRDVRAHDAARLRARATCIVSTEGIRDARLRHVEPIRRVTVAALDSLVARYAVAQQEAESTYARTPDDNPSVEDRFHALREWGRRAETVRAARRAAEQSAREASQEDDGHASAALRGDAAADPLLSLRAHVLVQYAGPAVGPDRVERDVIVRLLRAPGGAWVVYAFDLASDPPGPIPF